MLGALPPSLRIVLFRLLCTVSSMTFLPVSTKPVNPITRIYIFNTRRALVLPVLEIIFKTLGRKLALGIRSVIKRVLNSAFLEAL
jgi:hypothetical protein